jgi:branched-chain amino acid transport system ATP-binding protein
VETPAVIEAYLGERYARAPSPAGAVEVTSAARPRPPPAPGPDRNLLEVRELCAGYGDVQVLWDVSLEVREGEVLALVGANGAGKTTLIRTLSQIVKPRSGSIVFAGRDLTRARPDDVVAAGILQVPQGRHLFTGLTVEENLLQGAYPRRDRAGVEEDLEWIFELLPTLQARRRQIAGRLSGGEQQMCAIGRALMGRPRLLLIDELSLGLAPRVVTQLLELVSRINQRATTVLLVEQDVQVALEHAHRGYVLETGRIVQSSSSAELLGDPRIQRAYLGL